MKRFFPLIAGCCLLFFLIACGREVAEVGEAAPDFQLVDTTGRSWNLAELSGQVVFLHFWATWCPSCRDELVHIQRLKSDYAAEPLTVLTVLYQDDPLLAGNMVATIKGDFPLLLDPDSKIARAYGLTGVPETYIIDQQGVLREKIIGAVNWDAVPARRMLDHYLAR